MPISALSESDERRLLAGLHPVDTDADLEELTTFMRAVRTEVPEVAEAGTDLIPRLAAAAEEAANSVAPETLRQRQPRHRHPRRLALPARVAMATGLLATSSAAMAVADVGLPDPPQSAIEAAGIDSVVSTPAPARDEPAARGSQSSAGQAMPPGDGQQAGGKDNSSSPERNGSAGPDHGRARGQTEPRGSIPGLGRTDKNQGVGPPAGKGPTRQQFSAPPGPGGTPPGQAKPGK